MATLSLHEQSSLSGCRMQWPGINIVHSWWKLAYVSKFQRPSARPRRLIRCQWAEVEEGRPKVAPPHPAKTWYNHKPSSSRNTQKLYGRRVQAEQAMGQMIAVQVTTARQLMHGRPEGRSNQAQAQEWGPHRSQEQVGILKKVVTLKAALMSVGKPRQTSAAAMQRLAEFWLYYNLQMTAQEAHHVTLCPQLKFVLNVMIQSRQNELRSKAI